MRELKMRSFTQRPGDCVFIPHGHLHQVTKEKGVATAVSFLWERDITYDREACKTAPTDKPLPLQYLLPTWFYSGHGVVPLGYPSLHQARGRILDFMVDHYEALRADLEYHRGEDMDEDKMQQQEEEEDEPGEEEKDSEKKEEHRAEDKEIEGGGRLALVQWLNEFERVVRSGTDEEREEYTLDSEEFFEFWSLLPEDEGQIPEDYDDWERIFDLMDTDKSDTISLLEIWNAPKEALIRIGLVAEYSWNLNRAPYESPDEETTQRAFEGLAAASRAYTKELQEYVTVAPGLSNDDFHLHTSGDNAQECSAWLQRLEAKHGSLGAALRYCDSCLPSFWAERAQRGLISPSDANARSNDCAFGFRAVYTSLASSGGVNNQILGRVGSLLPLQAENAASVAFRTLDKDRNGCLGPSEVREGRGGAPPPFAASQQDWDAGVVHVLDADSDGCATDAELARALRRWATLERHAMEVGI